MPKPTLYLTLGYPGAGKTTVSEIISQLTGAEHLWSDKERHKMFENPTHSSNESRQLYKYLNKVTDRLLSEGKSVVFDTNFNFYRDRNYLRTIAKKYGAETVVIWLTTPKDVSKSRAVQGNALRNYHNIIMPESEFERMSNHLQPPREDESTIEFDGTKVTPDYVKSKLGL